MRRRARSWVLALLLVAAIAVATVHVHARSTNGPGGAALTTAESACPVCAQVRAGYSLQAPLCFGPPAESRRVLPPPPALDGPTGFFATLAARGPPA